MELVRVAGRAPRFPFEEFRKKQREYDESGARHEWENIEELQTAADSLQDVPGARILGHFGRSTASKLFAWEFGELYAVVYGGIVLACLPGGIVVV